MDENSKKLLSALQAVLFIYGEEISLQKLAQTLKIEKEEVKKLLEMFEEELNKDTQGLTLLRSENSVQLVTKPDLAPFLEELAKEEFNEELTKASLETIAIIAYLGPVSRAEIDYIRGVNSAFIIRSLLLRKLVDRASSPERQGTSLYTASFDALKHMGISKIEDLPEYQKYRELLKLIRKDGQQHP